MKWVYSSVEKEKKKKRRWVVASSNRNIGKQIYRDDDWCNSEMVNGDMESDIREQINHEDPSHARASGVETTEIFVYRGTVG